MKRCLAFLAAFACACSAAQPAEQQQLQVDSASPAQPDRPPEYVLIHRNTAIRLAPRDDAPYLQYRTAERQAQVDARVAKEDEERREQKREELAEREEAGKERADRLRKRRRRLSWKRRKELQVRDEERAARKRYQRADSTLSDASRRARRDLIEAPHKNFIPFEVVGSDGDWLELSPVSRGAELHHCYQENFGEVDRLDATFWVDKSAPVPVTTSRVRAPVSDGAEVILLPGVALAPSDDDNHRVIVDGFVFDLPIPDDKIGTRYQPGRPFEAPMTDSVFNPIGFVEGHFRLGRELFPFNPYRKLYVTGTLIIGNRFYITTQTPCGEYTIRGPEELLEPVGRRGATSLSGSSESVDPPFARRGSQSYLPDGTAFAKVRIDFPLGEQSADQDGKACYRSAVWGETDAAVTRSLELCFDKADLVLSEE